MEVKAFFEHGLFGENSFIITEDNQSAIVDPSFIDSNVIPDNINLKYILLTHGHVDHIASVTKIAKQTGAKVVAHKDEVVVLENSEINLSAEFGEELKITPDILLNDNDEILLGSVKIKMLHTPGHTVGSCCYVVENHIFTGDTIMAGTIGRTDLPTASDSQMKNSIEKFKAIEGNFIMHCGHGEDTDLNAQRRVNPYF